MAAVRRFNPGFASVDDWFRAALYEYSHLRSILPRRVTSVMDIGAGLGLMDILIGRRYPSARLTLVDRDGFLPSKLGYGLAPWGDIGLTLRFVTANVTNPIRSSDEPSGRHDLIVSLRAWCHHFPVDVYLDKIRSCLVEGGRLIVDVRVDRNLDILIGEFGPAIEIKVLGKARRFLFIR